MKDVEFTLVFDPIEVKLVSLIHYFNGKYTYLHMNQFSNQHQALGNLIPKWFVVVLSVFSYGL